jgi:hypothetical protein
MAEHVGDGPGNYCPHGDYSGRIIPLLERPMTVPIPEDGRCTGTTSVDDGVTRHETECPVHPATDETPEYIGDRPANPDEYNGWANRETWAANLWLTNSPELYEATLDAVRSARAEGIAAAAEYGFGVGRHTGAGTFDTIMGGGGLEDIAELLRDDPRNGTPEMMLRDIGSAWRIDWRELFAGLLEHLDDMAATAAEDES